MIEEHVQTNQYGVSNHLTGCNHHHSTEKHPLYNLMPMKLDVYTPILSHKSSTSCHRSVFLSFSNSGLIKLAFEWMNVKPWISKLSKVGYKKRYIPPLPTSGGFWWCLYQSCSSKTLKVVNPISLDCDKYFFKKPTIFCVFTLKAL
jgi:hypothetical protein